MSYSDQDLGTQKSGGLLMSNNVTNTTPKAFPDAPRNSGLGSIYKTGANSYGDAASLSNSAKQMSAPSAASNSLAPLHNDAMATQNATARRWSADRAAAGGRPFVDHAAGMHGSPISGSSSLADQMKWASGATTGKSFLNNTDPITEIKPQNTPSNISLGDSERRAGMMQAENGYMKGGLLVTPSTSKIYGIPYYN